MTWTIHQLVLGLHILLAIAWSGGILFVGWGVFPSVKKLDFLQQQRMLTALMERIHHLLTLLGSLVIVTGILLGTVLGPIKSLDALWQTSFGHKFALALLIGMLALFWGANISYRFTMKLLRKSTLWEMAENGYPHFLQQSLRNVMMVSSVEVAGFVTLLAIMVYF